MSDSPQLQQLWQQVEQLLTQNKLTETQALARKGKYAAALNQLKGIGDPANPDPQLLDLQARIYAQQGRLADAERAWRQALELDHGNPAYSEGLAGIARIQRRPVWAGQMLFLLLGLLLCLPLAWWLAQGFKPRSAASNPANQQAWIDSLSKLRIELRQTMVPPGLAPIDLKIQVPGIRSELQAGQLVLSFDEALFDEGTRLRPKAPELIRALAAQLEAHADRLQITIYGCTDPLPLVKDSRYQDNVQLGRVRALKVLDLFRQHSELNWNQLLIGSLGEAQYPFANNDSSRNKNRTVIMYISKK